MKHHKFWENYLDLFMDDLGKTNLRFGKRTKRTKRKRTKRKEKTLQESELKNAL